MSLPHALLTALVERPSTGAELARRFDRSIGYFWQATHQQIYRELGRLEEAGWVQSTPEEGGKGRQRRYQVLPAGRAELRRWTAELDEPAGVRDGLMVRLRAEAALGPCGLEDALRRRVDAYRERLALYRALEQRDFARGTGTRAQKLQLHVLRSGIEGMVLRIAMAEQALALLALPATPDDAGRPAATPGP